MIIVTGAAGFIGSQCLMGLNERGVDEILAVDDLTEGRRYINLARARIADYLDYEALLPLLEKKALGPVDAIIHQGACSTTTEWNGRYMMEINYHYTKRLYHYCMAHRIPLIYASSGAVYGCTERFCESDGEQLPLNVYGYSKWLFDQYRLRHQSRESAQVVGLRYFNVYGPHESHKGSMASVVYHFTRQLLEQGVVKLFGRGEGCEAGEHCRDFIYVKDVVKIVLWFLDHSEMSGIYNVGTGQAESFNTLAKHLLAVHGSGAIEYLPFPKNLKGCYQSFTEADLLALRKAGYAENFTTLEEGVRSYYRWLVTHEFS